MTTITEKGATAPASSRNLTYVVADIHGRFDCLSVALVAIETDAREYGGSRTVVFTGDYVDRGPQSREVLERLMAGPPDGWQWICLKGNREDMMVGALTGRDHADLWICNGGTATLESFGELSAHPRIEPSVLAWIGSLPLLHTDQHRVFVHAGVDPTIHLEHQTEEHLLWSRTGCTLGHGDRHVIHGHTPDPRGPRVTEGRTNLDTMAFRTGRLVVAVFDDDVPGSPIRFLECVCETEPRRLVPA